jgi:hypothetical protein
LGTTETVEAGGTGAEGRDAAGPLGRGVVGTGGRGVAKGGRVVLLGLGELLGTGGSWQSSISPQLPQLGSMKLASSSVKANAPELSIFYCLLLNSHRLFLPCPYLSNSRPCALPQDTDSECLPTTSSP